MLVEIATAIAYASEGINYIARDISRSTIPKFLIDHMYNLVNRMSTSKTKQLMEEKDFIHKVKIIRQ